MNYYRDQIGNSCISTKTYQLYKNNFRNIEDCEQEVIELTYEKYKNKMASHISFSFFDKGQKINVNLPNKRSIDNIKKMSNEFGVVYNSNEDFVRDLNYDLKFLQCLNKKIPEKIRNFNNRKSIKIYSVNQARADIDLVTGYNKIMTGGFSHTGFDQHIGFDEEEAVYKDKVYSKTGSNKFEHHEARLKKLISKDLKDIEGIRIDEEMQKMMEGQGLEVEKIIKEGDYYITERNPVHLMQSVSRYGLAPMEKKEVLTSLSEEEAKFIYFYLRNRYEQIGLKNWKCSADIKFNSSSSPGYLWNRKFKENKSCEDFTLEYINYFNDLVQQGINPTMPFCAFEKLCVQKRSKIQELRTISQGTVVHSVIGKRYAGTIEHFFSMNHGLTENRMAQQTFSGHLSSFCFRNEKDNNWLHREEDFSKQDIFENPILMDIITQVRLDTFEGTKLERDVMICIEEQNKRPTRVSIYGEMYRNFSKCSGGSHTCLNNTDKHMVVNALLYSKIICKENDFRFEEKNFKTLWKILNDEDEISTDVFSDDCLVHIRKKYKKYFMDGSNKGSLQEQILKKCCLYMKEDKISQWRNSIYVGDPTKPEGLVWLGNHLYKDSNNKIFPIRTEEKIIFGLCTLNPESIVAKMVFEGTLNSSKTSDMYRLMKLFSYMTMSLPNERLFKALLNIRDMIVKKFKNMSQSERYELIDKMYSPENERILGMFVSMEQIHLYGKNVDIWTREDFIQFITERASFFSNPVLMHNFITELIHNGGDFSQGSNYLIDYLTDTGFKIRHNENSKFIVCNSPRRFDFDKVFPFININSFYLATLLNKVPWTEQDIILDKEISLWRAKKIIKEKYKFDVTSIKYKEQICFNFLLLTVHDLEIFKDEKENIKDAVFLVQPISDKFLVTRTEIIYKKNNTLLYSKDNSYNRYNLDELFENYNFAEKHFISENFDLCLYTGKEKEIEKPTQILMASNCDVEEEDPDEQQFQLKIFNDDLFYDIVEDELKFLEKQQRLYIHNISNDIGNPKHMTKGIAVSFADRFGKPSAENRLWDNLTVQKYHENVIVGMITKENYYSKPTVESYWKPIFELVELIKLRKMHNYDIYCPTYGTNRDKMDLKTFFETVQVLSKCCNVFVFEPNKGKYEELLKIRDSSILDIEQECSLAPNTISFGWRFDISEIDWNNFEIFGFNAEKHPVKIRKYKNSLLNWQTETDIQFYKLMIGQETEQRKNLNIYPNTNSMFTLVNGGPGCGKTTQMVELIKKCLKKELRVLLISNSNEHVINACERMNSEKINYKFDYSDFSRKNGLIPDSVITNKRKSNSTSPVLCMTTSMLVRQTGLGQRDVLMIDEVSRMTIMEAFFVMAFSGIKNKVKKVYFFGDKYQANIYNPKNYQSEFYKPVTHLMRNEEIVYLNESYRLGPKTIRILNSIAYKEEPLVSKVLFTRAEEERIIFYYTCLSQDRLHRERIEYQIDESKEIFYNHHNVSVVKDILKTYENAVVITPYNSQKELYLKEEILCYTIDGAQGREWDDVIVDIVRCNKTKKIGFIDEIYRFIVAISRHRKRLHIVGCSKVIYNSHFKDIPLICDVVQKECTELVVHLGY
ncbi:ORF2 [Nidovirales sp.]|nr:ORF2 [Nidovirales sp.]